MYKRTSNRRHLKKKQQTKHQTQTPAHAQKTNFAIKIISNRKPCLKQSLFFSELSFGFTTKISICNGPFLHKWTYSLAAWSNSPELSVRQLLTTAQQQLCLISPAFLNLGCQGSLVGGCLLYFFQKKKKSDFFFSCLSYND